MAVQTWSDLSSGCPGRQILLDKSFAASSFDSAEWFFVSPNKENQPIEICFVIVPLSSSGFQWSSVGLTLSANNLIYLKAGKT